MKLVYVSLLLAALIVPGACPAGSAGARSADAAERHRGVGRYVERLQSRTGVDASAGAVREALGYGHAEG